MPNSAPLLRLVPASRVEPAQLTARRDAGRRPLGQVLLERRAVDPGDMLKAIVLRNRQAARLEDVLLAHGWVSAADLLSALSLQWSARIVDLNRHAPDARLVDAVGARLCLTNSLVPWRSLGGATIVVTSRPELFAAAAAQLPPALAPFVMALSLEQDVHQALTRLRRMSLARLAETRVAAADSCRSLPRRPLVAAALAAALGLTALAAVSPALLFAAAFGWAAVTLAATTALKLAACAAAPRQPRAGGHAAAAPVMTRLPHVSVMVPLFREEDIATRLIARLKRLDYPREALDILLVVEETDAITRAAIARTDLPHWIRVIGVPEGPIRTKPRALNYALDFCRGSLIGVYDAEDQPDPDQIRRVAGHFDRAGPDLACVQGILDFRDTTASWLARCFTIEYAVWFRVILPGLARLGLAVPLGGTTVFFRRDILESLGGWDAHNVTEDADLGLRLARRGYRTDILGTVTTEEPNSRALPWVRQRSRWLKGYAVTWATHMRSPRRLWSDLGPRRFLGVQVLFLGTVSQFLLAPVLWSFWLLAFGLPHPLGTALPPVWLGTFSLIFVGAELANIVIGLRATSGAAHRHLRKWVPGLCLYYPLATAAAFKAAWELLIRPFYWDKTQHGLVDDACEDSGDAGAADVRLPPASGALLQRGAGQTASGPESGIRTGLPHRMPVAEPADFPVRSVAAPGAHVLAAVAARISRDDAARGGTGNGLGTDVIPPRRRAAPEPLALTAPSLLPGC